MKSAWGLPDGNLLRVPRWLDGLNDMKYIYIHILDVDVYVYHNKNSRNVRDFILKALTFFGGY